MAGGKFHIIKEFLFCYGNDEKFARVLPEFMNIFHFEELGMYIKTDRFKKLLENNLKIPNGPTSITLKLYDSQFSDDFPLQKNLVNVFKSGHGFSSDHRRRCRYRGRFVD